ncbi:unnamed protein product, partial [Rotaria sordida]
TYELDKLSPEQRFRVRHEAMHVEMVLVLLELIIFDLIK